MIWFDWTYILILPALIVTIWAQARVSGTFNKYAKVAAREGYTAAQVAQSVLTQAGVSGVTIERTGGRLTDHYDPRRKVLCLSDATISSNSIAAIGVAAHEAGHAIQDQEQYSPLLLRNAAVPAVNITSNLSWPLFLVGLIAGWTPLLYIGIGLFAFAVVFALITLPVEFNASARALAILSDGHYLDEQEMEGARKVLSAAAMTYVAAAFTAIMQLLRLLVLAGNRRRD